MINRAFSLLERLRGILNENIGPYLVHSRVKGTLALPQDFIEESEVTLSLRNLHPTLVFVRMRFVNDDKVHPVLDALLHHDESTDSPVAVLERMQMLEPCVKTGNRLEVLWAALPFGEQCRYGGRNVARKGNLHRAVPNTVGNVLEMTAFPVGRHGRSLVKDRLEFNEEFRRQLDSERVDHSIEHLERLLGLNDVVKVVVSRNLIPCIERLDLIEREGRSLDLVRVVEEF